MGRAWVWALLIPVVVLLSAADGALKLDATSVTEDGPRVTLRLRFSGTLQYEYIAQYAKNQIILHVPGLEFSKQQLKSGLAVGETLSAAVRGGAYEAKQGYGEIRLQLSKGLSPGDVQLIPKDTWLDLQFIVPGRASKPAAFVPDKPTAEPASEPAKLPNARVKAEPAALPAQEEGDTTEPLVSLTGQTFADPPVRISTGDPSLTTEMAVDDTDETEHAQTGDSGGATGTPGDTSAEAEGANSAGPTPAAEPDGGYSPDELAEFSGLRNPGGSDATADPQPDPEVEQAMEPEAVGEEVEPATTAPATVGAGSTAAPSYKRFDLDQIPAKQVEIRDVPFREALMQLVAGSGFNVVVGSDIDNESVYLNFKSKQISLKEALETLCIAYELSYSIEDSAIVITRQ